MVGALTWKASRFGGTLPDRHSFTGHTMPDIGSQISTNRLNSRNRTENQQALRLTDSKLLTLAEARSTDLTFLESPAMPVSDLRL